MAVYSLIPKIFCCSKTGRLIADAINYEIIIYLKYYTTSFNREPEWNKITVKIYFRHFS